MSIFKDKRFITLAGIFAASIINIAIVHFWLADLFAEEFQVSRSTSYKLLLVFSAVYCAIRAYNIVRGKDGITNYIEKKKGRLF